MIITEAARNALQDFNVPDELGFGQTMAPVMIQSIYENGSWSEMELLPYQSISMDPATSVLHYAQEIFEGLKAYKSGNGKVSLFRPEYNAGRFVESAQRMAMPEFPPDWFLKSVETMAAYCEPFIPAGRGESLYLRPFMFCSEVGLGVRVCDRYHYLLIASPSGSYFSGESVKVFIERTYTRAATGGVGTAKTGGNYARGLLSKKRTHEQGCEQTLWLDACERTYIEEMSGMNFFAVIDGELHTPELTDSILNGCTRDSIIQMSRAKGYTVHERKFPLSELLTAIDRGSCTECFLCGTAAIVTPVQSFKEESGEVYRFADDSSPVAMELRNNLLDIQTGQVTDPMEWVYDVKVEELTQ